ncbi:MAG: hypothetical protein CSA11_03885 [Chloroflexi bacterium]|nr:MAG: hypothetical protein CSA11_03885 [Chloroflexota bacterium]
MIKRRISTVVFFIGMVTLLVATVWLAMAQDLDEQVYLPLVGKPLPTPTPSPTATPDPPINEEFRGLWVTRFDWTEWDGAHPSKIDEIVQDASSAGFNVLMFQIRGEADAYYSSNIEPWARRVSGNALGQPPGSEWDGLGDPLSYMITQAHAAGLQVHAYVTVYPVAACNAIPSASVWPTPLYHRLIAEHGMTGSKVNGLQWLTTGEVFCSGDHYLWATPASLYHDWHVVSVVKDVANRYDIDGLHLDRIRYSDGSTSCDPVSLSITGRCFGTPPVGYTSYQDWQRAQVNGTVNLIYHEVLAAHPDLWISAAVWPVHTKKAEWGWPESYKEGYYDYYQDSKAWIAGGYIDSISPMIYPASTSVCPDGNVYWSQSRWQTLVADFMAERNGRYIIPGIGGHYCSFSEIASRIQMARDMNTAGHAIFSYRLLSDKGYFDDLAAGPYAETAVVPGIPWRE